MPSFTDSPTAPPYVTTPTVPDLDIKVECGWEREMLKKARRVRAKQREWHAKYGNGYPLVFTVFFHTDGRVSYFDGAPNGMVSP